MKDTLHYLVKNLVDHPEEIVIDEHLDGDATILTIHVNQEDIGKVIGKSGRIIRSLRDMMKILAAKRNMFVDVEIAEDENAPTDTPAPAEETASTDAE